MVRPFWIARKKLLVVNLERKRGKLNLDGIRRDVQLAHFNRLRVPLSQQLSRLTSLHYFSCLKWPLKIGCFFVDNSQVLLNYLAFLKAGSCFHASNKIQSNPQAHFTPVNYPDPSAASNECPDSILLLWPIRTHIVLLSSSLMQVAGGKIYIWRLFCFTGSVQLFQLPVNDLVNN